MAIPKDFSVDGAVGAGGPGMSSAPGMASSSSVPPSASTTPPAPQVPAALDYAGAAGGGGGGLSLPSEQRTPSAGGAPAPSGGISEAPTQYPSFQTGNAPGSSQGSNVPQGTNGIFFDQGGGVPDDAGSGDPSQQGADPMSSILQRSLGSVDQTLQQMYKQYGLGGDSQAGGGVQDEAASMSTIPGNQSNSGIPPLQPGPGTLAPSSNPFGQRSVQPPPQRMSGGMPAVPGEDRGGSWDKPPMRPGPSQQPSPAPGTWKLPARSAGIKDDGDSDDQGSA